MRLSISFFFVLLTVVSADLQVGFYSSTCPMAESIIQSVVQRLFTIDPSITAALLRMHFHDCFVRGCDASILITGTGAEKTSGTNLNVRGYDIIDEAKSILEAQCPSTVSCADIITVATRDSVALAGGPKYDVPTGRRDGVVSNASEVALPSPGTSVPQALKLFADNGMTASDMVTLLGAHTVGISHCSFFQSRLTNFKGTGSPDSSMDSSARNQLLASCTSPDRRVFMDQTPFEFDTGIYKQILSNFALLGIDQEIGLDSTTSEVVASLASDDGTIFRQSFAQAIVKLGSVGVLVNDAGQIRKECRSFNP